MTAVVAQEPSEMSCVLIPLERAQLLLPSVCVAEIMPWRRIKTVPDLPDWCLGLLGWRGETVPVVRFERLNNPENGRGTPGRCLVVMNRTGGGATPFYALAADALPRLLQLSESDVTDEDVQFGEAESRVVRLGTEVASVPDLHYIERQLTTLKLPNLPSGSLGR